MTTLLMVLGIVFGLGLLNAIGMGIYYRIVLKVSGLDAAWAKYLKDRSK